MECQGAVAVAGAVLGVAHHRMPFFGEVNPDLVLASGQEMNLQQRQSPYFFQNRIFGVGEFSRCLVGGGIDVEGTVFSQVAADGAAGGGDGTMNDGEIPLVALLPVLLQVLLDPFAFGQHQYTGGLTVKAMDDIDPVPRAGITLAHIVVENGVNRSGTIPPGANGEQAARLFHDDQISVFMEQSDPFGVKFTGR